MVSRNVENADSLAKAVQDQATRHQRATDEQPYLVTDLEMIEGYAQRIREALQRERQEQDG